MFLLGVLFTYYIPTFGSIPWILGYSIYAISYTRNYLYGIGYSVIYGIFMYTQSVKSSDILTILLSQIILLFILNRFIPYNSWLYGGLSIAFYYIVQIIVYPHGVEWSDGISIIASFCIIVGILQYQEYIHKFRT